MATEALGHLRSDQSFFRAYALTLLGQAHELCGDHMEAFFIIQRNAAINRQSGNALMMLDALCHLSLLMHKRGLLREATAMCNEYAAALVDESGKVQPIAGMVYVPLGISEFLSNDLHSALQHLKRGTELAQQLGFLYLRVLGQCWLARVQHALGQRDAA